MVREYVGARYVPKFANPVAWTSGTSYEAMTIVTYNNSSYTSKIPVPATVGNPADNPTYWALTGNYNAQVEEYRTATENALITANSANTVAENALTKVNNAQPKIYKKAILIGDSWGVGYYDSAAHDGQSWGDYACPLLGVTDKLNMCSGGSGFTNGTGEHFKDQISRAHTSYPAYDDADLIICVGGFNDAQDNQTLNAVQTAAGAFFNNCFTYYPNAEVHMFPLQLPYGTASIMTHERWEVLSGIKQAFYNQTIGNLFIHDGIRRWANSFGVGASAGDGAHLNQYGYNYMGQLIAMCIRKCSSYYPSLSGTFDLTNITSYLTNTITNYCAETNGIISANLTLEVNAWPTQTYVKVPDFMNRPLSYFWVGDTLFVWNENGIAPNSGTYSGIFSLNYSGNGGF